MNEEEKLPAGQAGVPPEEIPQEQPVNKETTDEITSSAQPVTESEQPQTEENMEVHHHSHPAHEKKTWKDYFWEFLMLFLAVFCGFLAEWQLEHVIEHSREKEYMESMIIDIHTDSVNLDHMNKSFGIIGTQIDSLIPLLKNNDALDLHAAEIYQHQVYLNLYTKWTYSDRTIDQLKNSGNFRLIRNKAVSDGISEYDGYITNYIADMQNNLILKQWINVGDASTDIFKSSVFRNYLKGGFFVYHAIILPDTPYFLTNDKLVLQKFVNKLDQYAVSIDWFRINIKNALKQNEKLNSLIKKEYHLQ